MNLSIAGGRPPEGSGKKVAMTGNTLKCLALVSMLLDHIGAVLMSTPAFSDPRWQAIMYSFRFFGRLAFPIYSFLLVEGFLHTKNLKRYAESMLFFAVISEIPFDLAFYGTFFYPQHQNVYVTLFLGLLVLKGLQRWEKDERKQWLVLLMGCLAAFLLKSDYDILGILMISSVYWYRNDPVKRAFTAGLLAFLSSIGLYGGAVLAFLPLSLYRGERGRSLPKYAFYWFYPIHLIVLCLVGSLISRQSLQAVDLIVSGIIAGFFFLAVRAIFRHRCGKGGGCCGCSGCASADICSRKKREKLK